MDESLVQQQPAASYPSVIQEEDSVTLQFQDGEIQSRMLASDPNALVISYTQAMMAFRVFHEAPRSIVMIGLGGGSMAKWCYHQFPSACITVVEINAMVIALRKQFRVPDDDCRFRILCADGADYVAAAEDSTEVLLVDGFDSKGQPPQLCSQAFYRDCYRSLASEGLLVANLCGPENRQALEWIRMSFHNRVLTVVPSDGENEIVFAWKGKQLWIDDLANDDRIEKIFQAYVPVPFTAYR